MTWLFIEPTDVWLFRDGKPFDAGSDHRARSLFPPNPTTIQGAIRAELLMASGVPLTDFSAKRTSAQAISQIIGWRDEPPRFQVHGPFVAHESEDDKANKTYRRYFPIPADVVKVKGKREYLALKPLKDNPFRANWPRDEWLPLWSRSADTLEEANGWLSEDTLLAYLSKGELTKGITVRRDDELFARESRFGVGIDSRVKRPEEGLLYQTELIRTRTRVGLLVEIEDSGLPQRVQFPDDRLMSIGGESRGARYTVLTGYAPPAYAWPPPNADGKRLKLYFATPAWFAGGWEAADWRNWLPGTNLRPVAAAVRRAQPIGGARVDTESQKGDFQKAMHRYVSAGSVFLFEADDVITYNGDPVTDSPEEGKIGFGQVLLGAWDYA
jgi:CRISPR-associated protein Cmr3